MVMRPSVSFGEVPKGINQTRTLQLSVDRGKPSFSCYTIGTTEDGRHLEDD